MADVNLVLRADNTNYIRGVKQAQKASQDLHNTNEKGHKRTRGLIEDIERSLTQLEERRKKAFTVEHITKYNQKIAEAKQSLREYETAGVKANENIKKSGDTLMQSMTKWVMGIGAVMAAFRVLKDLLMSTTTGINSMNIAGVAARQVLTNLLSGTLNLAAGLREVITAQKQLNALRLEEKLYTIGAKKELTKYNEALVTAHDQLLTGKQRIAAYDDALLHLNKSVDLAKKPIEDRIKALKDLIDASRAPKEKWLLEWADLTAKLEELDNRRVSGQKEISSMQSGLIKSGITETEKFWEDYDKWYEDRINELIKEDKRLAAEKLANEWRIAKETMDINQEVFDYIENLQKDYAEQQDKKWKSDVAFAKKLFNFNNEQAEKAWEKMLKDEKKVEDMEKFSSEQREENLSSLVESTQSFIATLDDISQRQIEKLEFEREIFNTKISELQSELQIEANLREAGFASNVDAKQKELDKLKEQRDKALIEEEKARKKAHQVRMAALLADKAAALAQVVINTRIANAKAVAISPLTFGQPWVAANNVAAALSIAAIIAAAATAATAKFAEGGWTGKGGKRDNTGQRMAGIVHEEEFVVKRGPAHKFREVLEAINKNDKKSIFNEFNKLNPELISGPMINNVRVENSGPNNRLDRINSQLTKLNSTLKPKKQNEVIELERTTIQRSSNVTRVIRR